MMTKLEEGDFKAVPHEAICPGFCVVMINPKEAGDDTHGEIYYAGPLGGLDDASGKHVLMHPIDIEHLENFLAKCRREMH